MEQFYLCLSMPEKHFAPSEQVQLPVLICYGYTHGNFRGGENTLIFSSQSFFVTRVFYQNADGQWQRYDEQPFAFSFSFVTAAQRADRLATYTHLAQLLQLPYSSIEMLAPLQVIRQADEMAYVYHYLEDGKRGSSFVAYERCTTQPSLDAPDDIINIIKASDGSWQKARAAFNGDCWYTKWAPEIEMERKFTFPQPIDPWQTIRAIYREIYADKLTNFVPEFDDEFQFWDFENFMYEVLAPPEEAGYISFIPQADGLMTMKRKRFVQDTEMREEKLTGHLDLRTDQIDSYVKSIAPGPLRALPPFRRKRFDINVESLRTGNHYGIVFDVSRPFGDMHHALYQCEIEYMRSRIMGPIRDVDEEFEQVCQFVRTYLSAQHIHFNEGYFSKLSFLRDYIQITR
jgi:hypothetical protein